MNLFESFVEFKKLLPNLVGMSYTFHGRLPATVQVGEKSPHKIELHLGDSTVICYLGSSPTRKDELIVQNLSMSILEFFERTVSEDFRGMVTSIRKRQAVELAARLSSHLRIDYLLKEIQAGLCDLLDAEAASILIYNEKKEVLEFMVTVGKASGKIEWIPVPMESVAGTVFQRGKTMIFNDLSKAKHFKGVDKASGFVTRNILGSPIWREKEKIGVIEVLNKRSGGFTEDDAQILDLFAKLIGFKLTNVKNYENASRRLKSVILSIATAIDKRDQYTHQHSRQVTERALEIGRKLGLPEGKLEELEISSLLHDVGKIGIKDAVLLKTGKLSDEEFKEIKRHPEIGAEIVKKVHFITPSIIAGILQHHEKLDGSGYPRGLKGDEIDLFGKIVAVADVFDALASARPYKDPWPVEKVLNLLERDSGTKFDERCVKALKESLKEKGEV